MLLPLHHGLEMLLKAIIWQERREIGKKGSERSYSFDESIGIVQGMGLLDEDDARTLRILGARRDAVQHAGSSVSHEALAYDGMAALFLADKLISGAFGTRLADEEPFAARPLPLASQPPREYHVLISSEMDEIRRLLRPGNRRRAEAITRLRPLAVADVAAADGDESLGAKELEGLARRVARGEDWRRLFPALARLEVDRPAEQTYGFKIVRRGDAVPARIVGADDPDADEAVVVKEVDWTKRYPYGLGDLARKLGVNRFDAEALIHVLDLKADKGCFDTRTIGSATFKRYSHEAFKRMRAALKNGDFLSSARSELSDHRRRRRRPTRRG